MKATCFCHPAVEMLLVFIFTLLFKASALEISGRGTTRAAFGGEAHYNCSVEATSGVLQVLWQREKSQVERETLASFSERFGGKVPEPYKGKVELTKASLSSTSITVRDVSWADEGCYMCSFNVYPGGSSEYGTCLIVEGVSEVDIAYVLRGGHHGEDVEIDISCSATGKPAPTIDWDVSAGATRTHRKLTITEPNGDRTFTASQNMTLQVPSDWTGHVDCVLNRGLMGQQREIIPISLEQHSKDETVTDVSPLGLVLGISAAVIVCISVAVAALKWKKKPRCIGEVL